MSLKFFNKPNIINAQLAALRPGQEAGKYTGLLASATRAKVEYGIYNWKGCQVELNKDGRVEACLFSSEFSAEVPIEKLNIGMPIGDAFKAQPLLRYTGPQSFGDGYDLIMDGKPWDLMIDEVSEKVVKISIVAKGVADARFAQQQASMDGSFNSWNRSREQGHWTTLNDPYALLDAWLETEKPSAPWNNYPSNIYSVFASWLKQATPDEWHQVAHGHNWSYEIAPLFFISRHPDCDLATALHIFYATGPEEFARKEFNPARVRRHNDLRLVLGIRDRIFSGFYTRKELQFDPVKRFGSRWVPLNLGPEFPTQLEGRDPNRLVIKDGFPVGVWEAARAQS